MAKATTKATTKRSTPTKKAGTKKAGPRKATTAKAPTKKASSRATVTKTAAPRAASSKATVTKAGTKKASGKTTVAKTGGRTTVTKAGSRTTVKNAATGKTTAATKAKSNGLEPFLKEQLEALEAERSNYLHQAETLQAEADSLTEDREPGDVQFDEESGEGDTLAVERERDLALSAQARQAVEEIDLAVAKIHDGTYGLCETCGKSIPQERLKALPHAALCVTCKSGGLGLRR